MLNGAEWAYFFVPSHPNSSRLCGVWGDPDVHDLTPTRIIDIERLVPIDPQKKYFWQKNKIFWKRLANTTNEQMIHVNLDKEITYFESPVVMRHESSLN